MSLADHKGTILHIHAILTWRVYQLSDTQILYICTYTHRDVMTLLIVKEIVYVVALDQQRREGEYGKKGMDMVEARLSLMQGVFLAIQTSFSLKADVLLKAKHIFETLFNEHMTDTLKVRDVGRLDRFLSAWHGSS